MSRRHAGLANKIRPLRLAEDTITHPVFLRCIEQKHGCLYRCTIGIRDHKQVTKTENAVIQNLLKCHITNLTLPRSRHLLSKRSVYPLFTVDLKFIAVIQIQLS